MPTILYRNDRKISPGDVMKFAVYAEHVSRQCYDVFAEDGSRSRSEALSRRAQAVSDSLDFGDEPYFLAETTKKVLALRDMVSGMCFDTFGESGHMGQSMDFLGMARDVDEVLEKLVIYHLSPEELEEAEADWTHESQFYAKIEVDNLTRDGPGTGASA
ncbi:MULTISPECIES: hypothetical protein [Rhizobium]|uniref:Uncharacterized protein n=1 Tax=Rhizobium leguminosarum bv. viciae TaxID=387 RepID=A0A8G2IYQ3_RHILV|nr:hypothetical protein [Rhizobium leguminosarum]MBB4509685.1 hypothetical protein [Rhizobium leguminosarum]NKK08287.1 hypothetical protein [Rhizobium leguminosarum bv. viciae]NKK22037.1 hypothetical protein [Rhizobium leguminosarum bv. viciae]TBX93827.1 hypothetical protein E0H31_15110 [Rhizobium leguminosarum bv. viciae]TBZ17116.1 hypothetical protein E0H52_19485 [Rhizobium leguminosarum bv. viciae]